MFILWHRDKNKQKMFYFYLEWSLLGADPVWILFKWLRPWHFVNFQGNLWRENENPLTRRQYLMTLHKLTISSSFTNTWSLTSHVYSTRVLQNTGKVVLIGWQLTGLLISSFWGRILVCIYPQSSRWWAYCTLFKCLFDLQNLWCASGLSKESSHRDSFEYPQHLF